MEALRTFWETLKNSYTSEAITTTVVLVVLLATFVLSAYEFLIYRFVSHRSFYNKSFNISLAVLPFFIATIVLSLQSSLIITLGTIGALAIIRFRTAVKNPIDMIYLLWSVHTGIMCGCRLFEVAVLTSLVVTVLLFILDRVNFGRKPFVIVVRVKDGSEDALNELLKANTKKFRVKSRTVSSKGTDLAIEFTCKDTAPLNAAIKDSGLVEQYSIIEYGADDIV